MFIIMTEKSDTQDDKTLLSVVTFTNLLGQAITPKLPHNENEF